MFICAGHRDAAAQEVVTSGGLNILETVLDTTPDSEKLTKAVAQVCCKVASQSDDLAACLAGSGLPSLLIAGMKHSVENDTTLHVCAALESMCPIDQLAAAPNASSTQRPILSTDEELTREAEAAKAAARDEAAAVAAAANVAAFAEGDDDADTKNDNERNDDSSLPASRHSRLRLRSRSVRFATPDNGEQEQETKQPEHIRSKSLDDSKLKHPVLSELFVDSQSLNKIISVLQDVENDRIMSDVDPTTKVSC